MPNTTEHGVIGKLTRTCFAGALASFLTQPLEVLKTNMINSPSLLYRDLHALIVSKGWKTYMQGGSIAVARQAYGFALYTSLLALFEQHIDQFSAGINKYYKYSLSALTAKFFAMLFEAPLTLLKTRVQMVNSGTIFQECHRLMKSPMRQYSKGFGSSLAREGLYTFFHYNTYRFIKDDVLLDYFCVKAAFLPAFLSGIVAITISQPFEVIRSRISVHHGSLPLMPLLRDQLSKYGWQGFFIGYLPRLLRKPLNSGICWTALESIKQP